MPLNFVLTTHGNRKLEHQGYFYNRYRENKSGVTSWRCDVRQCKSVALTNLLNDDVIVKTSHTHAVDTKKQQEIRVKEAIKEKAQSCSDPPRAIIQSACQNIGSECAVALPSYTALARAVQRKRVGVNLNPHS